MISVHFERLDGRVHVAGENECAAGEVVDGVAFELYVFDVYHEGDGTCNCFQNGFVELVIL